MYAVIETGGKQYRVQEGDVITIEKLKVSSGDTITFDKVLILSDGATVQVGTPILESASVLGTVVENGKAEKVYIFKYKSKKDYRKKQGHRQPYTMVKIDSLSGSGKPAAKKAVEKPEVAETAAQTVTEASAAEKKPVAKKAAAPKAAAEKKPAAKAAAEKAPAAKKTVAVKAPAEKKPAAKKAAPKAEATE